MLFRSLFSEAGVQLGHDQIDNVIIVKYFMNNVNSFNGCLFGQRFNKGCFYCIFTDNLL